MSFNERMLAQVRLTTVNNTLLYTPPKNLIVVATYMIICSRGAQATPVLSWFHQQNGADYDDNTIIMDEVPFVPNLFHDWTGKIILNTFENESSKLTVTSDTADGFTLTLYGATIK